jgi:hypothetical protein
VTFLRHTTNKRAGRPRGSLGPTAQEQAIEESERQILHRLVAE